MKRPAVLACAAVAVASLGALAWIAGTSAEAMRPVVPPRPELAEVYGRAARASGGQRVLVVHAPPGKTATGEVLEGWQSPGSGWGLFPATPPGAADLAAALARLASDAADEWRRTARFDAATARAFWYFDVSQVLVEDGAEVVRPKVEDRDPRFGTFAEVPSLRVSKAAPVWLLLAQAPIEDRTDAISFARGLRAGDAQFQDVEDGLWGGALTVTTDADADHVFSFPASGARVTVDGRDGKPAAANVPLLVLRIPAGRHRVVVEYGEPERFREILAIAAAAALVVAVVGLFAALRPQPGEHAK
jgi:hypothetical protein